jgi:hypothetical protein
MKTSIVILTLGLMSTLSVSARDFGRSTTVVTGSGVATCQVSGYAVPGAVSRSVVTTDPQGRSVTTGGNITRTDGTRTATRSATGPNGQTKSVTKTTTRQ